MNINDSTVRMALEFRLSGSPKGSTFFSIEALARVLEVVPTDRQTLQIMPKHPNDEVFVNGRKITNWNDAQDVTRILVLCHDDNGRLHNRVCLIERGKQQWVFANERGILACMLEAASNRYSIYSQQAVFVPIIPKHDLGDLILWVLKLYYGFQAGNFSQYGFVRLDGRDITEFNELLTVTAQTCTLFLKSREQDPAWVQLCFVDNQNFWAAGSVYNTQPPVIRQQ